MNKNCGVIMLAIICALSLTACNNDKKKEKYPEPDTDPAALLSYVGSWIEPGTGLAVDIKEDALVAYRYTRETCSELEAFDNLDDAGNSITGINASDSGEGFSFLFNDDSELNRIHMQSTTLPVPCETVADASQFDPEFVFEHAWHAFNDYYPFFSLRGVDWQQQRETYRSQVTAQTSQQELYNIMESMLSPLDDGHVFLSVDTDEVEDGFSPAKSAGWALNLEAAVKAFGIDEDEARAQLINQVFNNIGTYYGDENPRLSFSDDGEALMAWGILEGNVGYLNILDMFVVDEEGEEVSTAEQIRIVDAQMDKVLDELKGTSAMIVDVRFNGGGSDEYSLAIANRFVDQRRLAYSREAYNVGSPTPREEFYIEPVVGKSTYSDKPVTLITGPNTGSAAEVFTLAMKALPTVRHIGEATEGILSDVLSFELTPGWDLGLSYQTYYTADDVVYEAIGVTPETEVPVTSFSGSIFLYAQPAIHEALVGLGVDLSISEEVFNTEVSRILDETALPGFSAAWIDDQQVLGYSVAGFADTAGGAPVTLDTPFNLGSVSKTLIGTSAMQMIERDLIATDTTLADVGMPYTVSSPYNDGADITLLSLATHTSGIGDSIGYGCGYYIEADQSSLFAQFSEEYEFCTQPVTTDLSNFLASILSADGALYDEDSFREVNIGEDYQYTNLGAALASDMLAVASGIEFEQWTEDNIFAPLGMNNTHWFNARYDMDDVKPATRYLFVDGEVTPLPEFALATWSDGGLKASASDLAHYLLAIVRGGELNGERILESEMVELMLTSAIDEPTIEGQGIFWNRDNFLIGHNGGDPGTSSEMRYDQYNKLGLTMMFNLTDDLGSLDEGSEEGELSELQKFEQELELLTHLVYRRGLTLKEEVAM